MSSKITVTTNQNDNAVTDTPPDGLHVRATWDRLYVLANSDPPADGLHALATLTLPKAHSVN